MVRLLRAAAALLPFRLLGLTARLAPAVLLLLVLLRPSRGAAETPAIWLRDHLAIDAQAETAWRSAWTNGTHSGFSALVGGGEADLGLEFGSGYGVLAGARVLAGDGSAANGQGNTLSYLEATGQLGGQINLTNWVRIELGASAGRIFRCCAQVPLITNQTLSLVAGGFLRFGVDWWPRESLIIRAFSLWLRLDVDAHPHDDSNTLPDQTLMLGLGLGLRL